ncbi:MAG TPA: oligosaccharide flippase family protein [Phototrophicaceae bacterium]|nr:oligosaccharide flippase family protein [Phototrophicaceae bacterium]
MLAAVKTRLVRNQSVINVGFRFLAQIVAQVGNFLLFPLLARNLGTEGFGVQTQLNAINGVLLPIATLGLGFSVVRLIAGKDDVGYISARFLSTLLLATSVACALGAGVFVAAPILNDLFIKVEWATSVIRLSAVMLVVMTVERVLKDYYRARMRIVAYSVFEMVQTALLVVGIVLVFQADGGLWEVLVVWIGIKAGLMVALVAYFRWLGEIRLRSALMPWAELLEMVRFGIPVVTMGLSMWVIGLGDRAVIGYYMDASSVGVYGSAYTLAGLLGALATAFWGPMYPLMAKHKNNGDVPRLMGVCRRYTNAYLVIGLPALVGLTVLSAQILRILGSADFVIHPALFGLIALGLFSDQVSATPYYLIYLHNEPQVIRNVTVFTALVNMVLNVIMVPRLGIWGSALATLITYGAQDILLARRVVFYGYRLRDVYSLQKIGKLTAVALAMGGVLLLLQNQFVNDSLGVLLLLVVVGGGVYGVMLMALNRFQFNNLLQALTE